MSDKAYRVLVLKALWAILALLIQVSQRFSGQEIRQQVNEIEQELRVAHFNLENETGNGR